ncbi:hypothetical protein SMICM304S_11031 [Streptomyces microflavus]
MTLRNPASEFSFLCYLQSRGRLIDFIDHENLFPLRVEFHDYFEWAAAKVDDMVDVPPRGRLPRHPSSMTAPWSTWT